jgi:hypothetical protein
MRVQAISEVTGTILLMGVIVLGVIVLDLAVFSAPTVTHIPALTVGGTNHSTLITLVHEGGDALQPGEFRILVDGVDRTTGFTNSGSWPWSLGETLSYNAPALPKGAVVIYNGTGRGDIQLFQIRFPYGVYVPPVTGTEVPATATTTIMTTPTTPAPVAWYDCGWGFRREITIDHTLVPGTQSNFPVLVSLTSDAGLGAHAQVSGNDILFTSSDGTTKIPHEIESYAAGTLLAWVNVSTVSSAGDTTFFMYYGNARAPAQQSPARTWDSNYIVVQHMDGASSGALDDSTGYHNDVTSQVGTPSYQQAGEVGSAVGFAGSDAVEIQDAASLDLTSQYTVCTWIRPASITDWNRIVAKSHTANSAPWTMYGLLFDDNNHIRDEVASGGAQNADNGATVIPLSTWSHACGTYDHASLRLYLNGNPEGTPLALSSNIDTNNMPLSIGRSGFGSDYFTGRIDEVRVSNIARSASWIQTEYRSESNPAAFASVGAEESSPCAPAAPSPAWANCLWSYRKGITIDKAKVTGTQSDFPVLVSLAADSDLQARARSDGYDLLFTGSDGQTAIPYEREGYDPATGALTAWVRVPSISSAANTTIYLYYGYASSPDMADPAQAWDPDYMAVWHMNATNPPDSTINGNTGTNAGSTDISGKVGRARRVVAASSQYVDIPSAGPSLNLSGSSSVTVEAWIYATSWRDYWWRGTILGKSDNLSTNNLEGYVLRAGKFPAKTGTYGSLDFAFGNGTKYWSETLSTGKMVTGQWHQVAAVFNGTSIAVYINGTFQNATKSLAGTVQDSPYRPDIGAGAYYRTIGNGMYFDGYIDEVRVSDIDRSDSWISTEYNNGNSPSTFSYPGREETCFC